MSQAEIPRLMNTAARMLRPDFINGGVDEIGNLGQDGASTGDEGERDDTVRARGGGVTLRFDDRVALVTGAAGGLGKAYAELLAARGARVFVNDLPPEGTNCPSVAELIRRDGGDAEMAYGDVSKESDAREVARGVLDQAGKIDIFIHNAGKATGSLEEHLALHLGGAVWIAQEFWPAMVKQEYGRILTTTSGVGLNGSSARGYEAATAFGEDWLYGVAKMALVGLTRHLAVRGESVNIKVNSISPIAHTEAMRVATAKVADSPAIQAIRDSCTPELVAPTAAFLVHERCPVTGEIFRSQGGHVMRVFFGQTQGYRNRTLTIEDMEEHLDEIRDETGYTVPVRAPTSEASVPLLGQ
jgi:NAD(P)-dependent dehydrogenase (short-subunit alcohol dehydrogenase family)